MSKSQTNRSRSDHSGVLSVVLADDHPIVRRGLRSLLARDRGLRIVGEAENGKELLKRVGESNPDIAIVDISMPEMNGIEAIRLLKKMSTHVKILVLTVHNDQAYVTELMLAGADGYLLKDADGEEVFSAIRSVMAGHRFFSASVSGMIVDVTAKRQASDSLRTPPPLIPLTKRESEILLLITQGLTSRAIARQLFLSVGTVFTHRNNLMKKLNIHDKASLVHYAIKVGLVRVKL
ncbi:MAG: response regulator transcription factor [Ignavibacteriales bacterium]|nr:response regulator transcription factor [Ignavibacteriales bacterium]